jgi:hypothetical protein
MNEKEYEARKASRLDSLKEYIAMLSAASNSLKTGLTGEEIATEIIKGALLIKKFNETGELSQSSDRQPHHAHLATLAAPAL